MDRIRVMELVRSFQVGEIDRRDFVKKATVAVGSVAAANALLVACRHDVSSETPDPVVADGENSLDMNESDSESGLHTEIVSYEGPDNSMLNGYFARPEEGRELPGIIVIQEWWGLNDHIKDVTRRFAREGYAALAPDLYHGVVVTEPDDARKLVMELDLETAVAEIQSAMQFLDSLSETRSAKQGLIGFCMGGRLVLQTALVEDLVGLAIPYYGSPLTAEEAANVKSPVLGVYGQLDGGIPVERVKAMEAGLNAAGIENKMFIYEGAGHAFFNDTRPSYHPEAAADAWKNTLEWLQRIL